MQRVIRAFDAHVVQGGGGPCRPGRMSVRDDVDGTIVARTDTLANVEWVGHRYNLPGKLTCDCLSAYIPNKGWPSIDIPRLVTPLWTTRVALPASCVVSMRYLKVTKAHGGASVSTRPFVTNSNPPPDST